MNEKAEDDPALAEEQSLEALEQRLRHWRESRQRGERIPRALWEAAADLARVHGVHRTARQLHLSHADLKKRLEPSRGPTQAGPGEPRFVELLGAPRATAAGPRECVIELENARGAKMRIELNAGGLSSLSGLCSAFWSAS